MVKSLGFCEILLKTSRNFSSPAVLLAKLNDFLTTLPCPSITTAS